MAQGTGFTAGKKSKLRSSSSVGASKGRKTKISGPRRPTGKAAKTALAHSEPFEEYFKGKLRDKKLAAAFLTQCIEDEDGPQTFLIGLKEVIDAHGGMANVAELAGVSRETLYRSLSNKGNPTISYLK